MESMTYLYLCTKASGGWNPTTKGRHNRKAACTGVGGAHSSEEAG